MAEVLFRAKLVREEDSNTWGFRLQGGVEFDKPLTLLKVVPESLAAKGGLHPGDIVVKLAGRSADDMTHKDAQEAIRSAGNALEIIVERAEVTITTPTSPTASSQPDTEDDTSTSDDMKPNDEAPSPSSSPSSSSDSDSQTTPEDGSTSSTSTPEEPKSVEPKPDTSKQEGAEPGKTSNDVKEVVTSPEKTDGDDKDAKTLDNDSATRSKGIEGPSNVKHKPPDNNNSSSKKPNSSLENDCNVEVNATAAAAAPEICDKVNEATDETTNARENDVQNSTRSTSSSKESQVKEQAKVPRNKTSVKAPEKDVSSPDDCDTNGSATPALLNKVEATPDKGVQETLKDSTTTSKKSKSPVPPNSLITAEKKTSNSESKSAKVPEKVNNNNNEPSPSVIKQFQANDVNETAKSSSSNSSSSTTSSSVNAQSANMAPKDTKDVNLAPKTLQDVQELQTSPERADETQQKLNIPQSSSAAVSSGKCSPTVAIVVEDIPKETIEATAVKSTKESPVTPSVSPIVSNSPKVKSTVSAQGEKPITFTPITIKNQKGEALAQTVLKSPSQPNRQTQAPAEEILVAPKPSVQIMPNKESKESAKLPVGETRKEEMPPKELTETKAPVSHEIKDFSKTAPWRMHKQAGSTPQPVPSTHAEAETPALHPWRKSRSEHVMSNSLDERQLSAAAVRLKEASSTNMDTKQAPVVVTVPEISQRTKSEIDLSTTKPQSTLTYVGKRIESPPVGSPVGIGAPPFKATPVTTNPPAGRDVSPSDRSSNIPMLPITMPSTYDPNSMLTIPSPKSDQYSPQYQTPATDIADIPMPAVKEMVENLNKRLEAIAVQHPKIVEPATSQELGLNYFRRSQEDLVGPYEHMQFGEREIIINTPPNPNMTSLEDMKQHLFGPRAGYPNMMDYLDAAASPASHRRRFSLPGGSVAPRHNQRRVRFAEPLESSVIEIEPRKQRFLERLDRRRFYDDEGSMSDMEDYSSASSLAAKLDRIERENALSNASFQRHRNAKHRAQNMSGDAQNKPAESFRDRVINFESLGEPKPDNVVLSSLKPKELVLGQGRSGSRGFSLSIGQNKPGSISLSLRGAGQPPVALSVPSSEGHFSYTISHRNGSSEPYAIRYSMPYHMSGELVQPSVHTKAPSLDSARAVTIQYPPSEGIPTIQTHLLNTSSAGPLSPPHQAIRQLAGRPGIRSPTSYSNTLQIDTSSRLQHRSPSPPHLSLSPNTQSERARLSPQRLAPPLSRLHDTSALDHQAKRSSSPIQGSPLAQQPGFKARQPSLTNPMAYPRSISPQGHLQYGPARGSSPIPYQQVPVQPSNVTLQTSSPRNSSPVSFQHPMRLPPNVGYQRSPSPQGLTVPQVGQYQPGQVVLTPTPRGPRMTHPQQMMQPPGYSQQPRHPRIPGSLQPAGFPIPRGQAGPQATPRRGPAIPRDVALRLPEGALSGHHPMAGIPPALLASALGQPPPTEDMPQGVFAYFDKKFSDKFLHWNDDRPDGLYESETYKLVHEMDEENEDL